LAERNR
jgi:hypothetical protein